MSLFEMDSQDVSVRDSLLVDQIMATTAADTNTALRYRSIIRMNPYMANNPQSVAAMANLPLPTSELMNQAGALYGMQVGSQLASQLLQYEPSMQRSIFSQLTPAQQVTLRAYGYNEPTDDVHGQGLFGKIMSTAAWPIGKVMGGVGKGFSWAFGPTFDAMYNVGETGMKAYRTIKQLDDASQWISLATGLATFGSIALAPITGGSSLAVTALLTAGRVGLAASLGTVAATAASFAASSVINGGTSTWLNAWSNAYDGERLFTDAGIKRANELLGMDANLMSLAQDLANESEFPGQLITLAQEIAGVRGSTDPRVQTEQIAKVAAKYAAPGTPAFDNAYEVISTMLTIPAFTEALNTLEKSKISMGRDIVRLFGGDPSTGAGRWLSGGFDMVSMFLVDPFLLAGKGARAAAMMRRGIQFVDTVNVAERFRQIALLPEVDRKLSVVANAVNSGDIALLNRGAKEYRPLFDLLLVHKNQLAKDTFESKDIVDYLIGTDKLKSVMKGVGVVPGASYGQIRGLSRGQYAWAQATGAARDALRGISDVRIENVRLPKIARDIAKSDVRNVNDTTIVRIQSMFNLSDDAARLVANFFSNLQPRAIVDEELFNFTDDALDVRDFVTAEELAGSLYPPEAIDEAEQVFQNMRNNSTDAYKFGRAVGNMPFVGQILSPFASFVDGVTTRIPGGAIHLTGLDAPDEISNFVELFRFVGMPSYARNAWKNAILYGDTAGVRLNAITALIDSAATASGMRLTKAGTDLLDEFLEKTKQIYGLGEASRYSLGFESGAMVPRGFRPVADMADMVAIPDLREMRKAVRQGLALRALLGMSENTHILGVQNRFWKPAVLLRAGFILRNVSEEMLSMLTRYGVNSWSQELVGRKIAQGEEYFKAEAKARARNQQSALSAYESYVLESRFDVPTVLRPVARAIERIPDGQPWQRVLRNYGKYIVDFSGRANQTIHELLLHGFGGQALRKGAARTIGSAAEATARERLNTIMNRLAFGNQYSLRRMMIGGIDETILNDMRAFEGVYLKQIMDTVGTSNLAPWERTGLRSNAVQRLLVDENSEQHTQLVQVLGERGLSTMANNLPNQQPFHDAALARVQDAFDDPIAAAAMKPLHITYDADIEAALPVNQMIDGLKAFAAFGAAGNKWDDDLLQLWTILESGTPRPDRFQALLQRMYIPESKIEELAEISSDLVNWAVERNAVVDSIRSAYPGQNLPTFSELQTFLANKHKEFLEVEFAQQKAQIERIRKDLKEWPDYRPPGEDPTKKTIDVTGFDLSILDFKYGYTRLSDQLTALSNMSDAIAGSKDYGRDWFSQLILNWHRDPELLHLPSVLSMSAESPRRRPSFLAYRGMTWDDLVDVDDQGNLVMRLTYRDWANGRPSVSFSLNDFQAKKYVTGQVGDPPAGANRIDSLFVVNGDALLESVGRQMSDVIGLEYAAPSERVRTAMGGEFFPHLVNPPKFPFEVADDFANLHRREFAITQFDDVEYIDDVVDAIDVRLLDLIKMPGPIVPGSSTFIAGAEVEFQDPFQIVEEFVNELRPRQLLLESLEKAKVSGTEGIADDLASEVINALNGFRRYIPDETVTSMETAVLVWLANKQKQGKQIFRVGDEFRLSGDPSELIGSSLKDLDDWFLNTGADLAVYNEAMKAMFPDVYNIERLRLETSTEIMWMLNLMHSPFDKTNLAYSRLSGPTITIPAGSWQAIDDPFLSNPTSDKLRQFSTTQNYWPFYSSIDEAKDAMRWSAHQEASTGQWDEVLKKNSEWHGVPNTVEAYVVDTRPLSLGARDTNVYQGPRDPTRRPGVTVSGLSQDDQELFNIIDRHLELVTKRGVSNIERENLHLAIMAAIAEQQPLVVADRKMADIFADIIEEYVQIRTGRLAERPLIATTNLPADDAGKTPSSWTSLPVVAKDIKGKTINTYIYGTVEPDQLSLDGRLKDQWRSAEPFIWDFIDENAQMPGPANIIETLMEFVDQRVRGGRRMQVFTRQSENAYPVYRNVNGEAVALERGERISPNERYFSSPRMSTKDIINPGDQRYFQMGEITYEGSSQVMWPVLAPVMMDHAEAKLGLRLYDLKGPVEVPTVGNRREKIFTNRQRIPYATTDHVAKTPSGDLPDWEIVQLYRPVKQNLWDRAVQFGFNNVIGPTIDAITRKPMAAHAFHIAAERNRNMTKWLINSSKEESALRNTIAKIETRLPTAIVSETQMELWAELGRAFGATHGAPEAGQWDDLMSLAFLRGLSPDEFNLTAKELLSAVESVASKSTLGLPAEKYIEGLSTADRVRFGGLVEFVRDNFDALHASVSSRTGNTFLAEIDRLFGEGAALAGKSTLTPAQWEDLPDEAVTLYNAITPDDWFAISTSAKQRQNVNQEVYEYAAEHTIRDIMPYVDSHEIRSQFADSASALLPFWYAEENFLKRWSKIFTEGGPAVSLERIRKLQLTYQGLKNVGIVRTDAQGRDYFVYPGSELLFDAIDAVLPGSRVPVQALIQTPTSMMIPGFSRDFGRPSLTPFAAVSMDFITAFFPEARTFEEALIGKEYVHRNVVDSIVPRHVANIWQSIGDIFDSDINPNNQRVASAMMAAIAHEEANGRGLPDNATPSQRDDYLRRIRSHARIIVFSQAIAGFFTAGPSQLLQTTDGGSLDWITDGAVTNPAELLSAQYYELISNLGIEKGTQQYLAINANANIHSVLRPLAYTVSKTASASGAPLPSTDRAYDFYSDNADFFAQYPDAGPWMFPQREDNEVRSQSAYDAELIDGFRDRRAPTEFITTMKYREGANTYFAAKKLYEDEDKRLRASGRTESAQILNREWLLWAEAFKATHPLFADMLTSDDARKRRSRVMGQIRYLIKDPKAPKADHFDALATLQRSFDAYQVARSELGLNRTTRGVQSMNALKLSFKEWVDDFIKENPALGSYWLTILEPESGLE